MRRATKYRVLGQGDMHKEKRKVDELLELLEKREKRQLEKRSLLSIDKEIMKLKEQIKEIRRG